MCITLVIIYKPQGLVTQYRNLLLEITDRIKEQVPERFARFFIEGNCHTTATFEMDGMTGCGIDRQVDGMGVLEWLGLLVTEDSAWGDRLE